MSLRSWFSRLAGRKSAKAAQAKPPMAMLTDVAPVHKQEPAQAAPQEWISEADVSTSWQGRGRYP